jgi:hypothetical protein
MLPPHGPHVATSQVVNATVHDDLPAPVQQAVPGTPHAPPLHPPLWHAPPAIVHAPPGPTHVPLSQQSP